MADFDEVFWEGVVHRTEAILNLPVSGLSNMAESDEAESDDAGVGAFDDAFWEGVVRRTEAILNLPVGGLVPGRTLEEVSELSEGVGERAGTSGTRPRTSERFGAMAARVVEGRSRGQVARPGLSDDEVVRYTRLGYLASRKLYNRRDREDYLQDLSVLICKHQDKIAEHPEPKAYVRVMANNLLKDHLGRTASPPYPASPSATRFPSPDNTEELVFAQLSGDRAMVVVARAAQIVEEFGKTGENAAEREANQRKAWAWIQHRRFGWTFTDLAIELEKGPSGRHTVHNWVLEVDHEIRRGLLPSRWNQE